MSRMPKTNSRCNCRSAVAKYLDTHESTVPEAAHCISNAADLGSADLRFAHARGKSRGYAHVKIGIHHIRKGKHGARSIKQVIAIALSKARRAGVRLPPPKKGKASAKTRRRASSDYAKGRSARGHRPSAKRS